MAEHVNQLLRRARSYCKHSDWDEVDDMYRNKPRAYFKEIRKHDGIMRTRVKDMGGDRQCPLKNSVRGLFFCVTLRYGSHPDMSPFGDTRVFMPLKEAVDNCPNLYFSDFYCLPVGSGVHYIQLVMTRDGSKSDVFCRENLAKLDPHQNSFLRRTEDGGFETCDNDRTYVEIFYTEDIDIRGRELEKEIPLLGNGQSIGGIPKSRNCHICNV